MGVLDNAILQYEDGKDSPVAFKNKRGGQNNSIHGYIRSLLATGLRGNVFYYRDDDRRLILKVWEHQGLTLTSEQRRIFMHDVSAPDTITRERRKFRIRFPDSPAIQEKRYRKFIEKRDEHSNGGWLGRRLKRIK